MTAARGAALAALVVAVAVVAVLLLRGGKQHEYALLFQNAGPARQGRRRAGRRPAHRLGRRTSSSPTTTSPRSRSRCRSPTRRCTRARRAVIRAALAVGRRQPLHRAVAGPELGAEARRRRDARHGLAPRRPSTSTSCSTRSTRRTRKALQQVIHGLGRRSTTARARTATRRPKYFNPALSTTSQLVNQLDRRPAGAHRLRRRLVQGRHRAGRAARRPHEPGLQREHDRRRRSPPRTPRWTAALGLLPSTLRKANTTFVNLRSTLDDLDTLVNASKPATKQLAPFFEQLRPLVADARPTIARPAHADQPARARATT